MTLFHRTFGPRNLPPLLLLHGLLGSSRNWITVGRALGHFRRTYALDLRNHGLSPHADSQEWDESVRDVQLWMNRHLVPKSTLLGHSLGGKIAMRLACRYPEQVSELIVVDVAPRQHSPRQSMFSALLGLDLKSIRTRREAESSLQPAFEDRRFLRFLLTNLERTKNGTYRWQPNLQTLATQTNLFESGLDSHDRFEGPTRFIVGSRSDYVRPEDHQTIRKHFPRAQIQVLPDCGHIPHAEQPGTFLAAVIQFIEDSRYTKGDPTPLLHLTTRSDWDEQIDSPTYIPAAFTTDGFVHCSTKHQLLEVAHRHFFGRADLLLLCIDPKRLTARPTWENLEGGLQPYPHIYAPIVRDSIYAVLEFSPSPEGRFELPPSLG